MADMLQLIWWLVEPEKLSTHAYAAIHDPAATIIVSAATGWGLATKIRLGKLPGDEGLLVATVVSSGVHDIRRSWTRPLCQNLQHKYHQHLIYCVCPFNPTSQAYSGNQP
jgi:hypothetical protein